MTTAPGLSALKRRFAPGLAGWVLLAGAAVTLALCAGSMRSNAAERRSLLERRAEAFGQALGGRLQSYIDIIPGLRVFGAQGQPLTDAEFLRYVEAISLQQRFPGLALSFIAERVDDEHRDAWVATVREDRSHDPSGHPGFDIQPPGRRAEYMVLRHQHPLGQGSFGYDLYDPGQHYRAPVDAAIASAGYVATGPLQLAVDRDRPADLALTSIVVRAATYRGNVVPATPEERSAKARGVVGVAFRTVPLVRSALSPELDATAHILIHDPGSLRNGQRALVYDNDPAAPPVGAEHGELIRLAVPVADRTWAVELQPRATPLMADADETSWVLLVCGLALSMSLAVMTRTLTRAQQIAQERIHQGTAQLQAEKEQLARSESRYRMLIENTFDAVLRTRPEGEILAANPAACAMFGMSEAELCRAGRGRLVDLDDPRLADLLQTRQREGRTRGTVTMIRGDGSRFEAELSSNLYVDSDGQRVSSMIVRDLSEAQRAAAQRQQLEAQLRHAQKMQAVGTLAGGIAHDFNNVLAVVLGNVAILQQDLVPGHASAPGLERIRQASLRARALVQQILAFSRQQPELRRVQPLGPLVDEALKLLRSTLPATVQLQEVLSDEALYVHADDTQVQQVVMNLCNNAWQALPGGQGRVSVQLARGRDAEGRDCARLSVSDDGIGMDEATRLRIFEPFFTTKPVGQGTGLGLAVVHGIVAGHGGAIGVDSAPGAGTRVTVEWPLAEAPSATPADPEPVAESPAAASGRGRRLLCIDDDEVVALTAAALLQRLGYHVTCRSDPRQALDELATDPGAFDLVVTDYNMPGLSGLEVAVAVRALRPGLPVVITSGHVSDELLQRAREMGVRRVMLKEYMLEQLGGIVGHLLEATDADADADAAGA